MLRNGSCIASFSLLVTPFLSIVLSCRPSRGPQSTSLYEWPALAFPSTKPKLNGQLQRPNMTIGTSGQQYQDDSTWSRIALSASGLAKTAVTPGGGHETTQDLSTLQTAHKFSGLNNYDNASNVERNYRALSNRHQAKDVFRSSQWAPDPSQDELEDELVHFLGTQCSFGNESASSSRSASPLDEPSGSVHYPFLTASQVRRTYQYDKWRANNYFTTALPYGDINAHDSEDITTAETDIGIQEAEDQGGHATLFDRVWDRQSQVSEDLYESIAAGKGRLGSSDHNQDQKRIDQAARRLQLVSSHISAEVSRVAPRSSTAAVQIPALESSYSQLCHGDGSEDWTEFLASMEALMHDNGKLQQNDSFKQNPYIQTRVQHQPLQQEPPQEEDSLISTFHCPWVGCHQVRLRLFPSPPLYPNHHLTPTPQHLKNGYQHTHTHTHTQDYKFDSLACIHIGCNSLFKTESDWREHILNAHHGIQASRASTPQTSGDVDSGPGNVWVGEFEGDHDFEGSFEDVWSGV